MTTQRVIAGICPKCGEEFDTHQGYCPHDGTRLRELLISSKEEDSLVGQEIDGRFSVDEILGEGGMGKVYSGTQLSVGRRVAIKVLRKELCSEANIVKRFFREAQVISGFSHPNIVHLIDFGQDTRKDILYLAMEFIAGTDMGDLTERHRLDPAMAVDIIIQVCEALSEPHQKGVTHRDLKPENIMLVPMSDGRLQAKVVDFGIAHALQNNTKLTQTGSVFGTVHYMAPEQAVGGEIGPHTDVYALGCILFELLTGSSPFHGETAMQLLMKHVQEEPPLLADHLPGGTEIAELSQLIRQMMGKKPQERPGSVLEVRDELEMIRRKHNHRLVRVNPSLSSEEMFASWVHPKIDVRQRVQSGVRLTETGDPVVPPGTDLHAQLTMPVLEGGTATPDSLPSGAPGKEADFTVQTTLKNKAEDSSGISKKAIAALAMVILLLAALVVVYLVTNDASDELPLPESSDSSALVLTGPDKPDDPPPSADTPEADPAESGEDPLLPASDALEAETPEEEVAETSPEEEPLDDEPIEEEPVVEEPRPTSRPAPAPRPRAQETRTAPAPTPAPSEPEPASAPEERPSLQIFTLD